MTTSINTNISAFFGQNNLRSSSAEAQSSIARLSSGNKIIRAADDVAGLSVGTILRTDVNTLKAALNNTSQASSLIQVADGAIERLGEILQRQKALAVQGNADTLSDTERGYLDQEFQALVSEYDRIVTETNFNGQGLLDGSLAGASDLKAATTTAYTDTGVGTGELTAVAFAVGTAADDRIVGSLENVTVQANRVGATDYNVSISFNGVTFTGDALDLTTAGAQVLTSSSGSTITLTTTNAAALADQDATDAFAETIRADLASVNVYQTRVVDSTLDDANAIDADTFNGTALEGLTGASFSIVSDKFSADGKNTPAITDFAIEKFDAAAGTGKLSVIIEGDVFSVDLTATNLTGTITLTNESDSNATFAIALGAIDLDVDTESGASALANTLNEAFGKGGSGGASFQVGTSSSDTIAVAITSVATSKVYLDDDGASQKLSVDTKANSIAASSVLDNAINNLTSVRAQVGAVQSRFDFAAATLETSVQNLDAARAGFLDADISAESTEFAQAQVLIQASISVLAQANQLPQNLLKLIG